MKFLLTSMVLCTVLLFSCKKDNKNDTIVKSESLSMGSNYANEIYYSLSKGQIATAPRNNWDIAFNTNTYSSTIITNDAEGVLLYEFKQGTDSAIWNTVVDTTGLYAKPVLYNSDTTWAFGAFERNMQGHPDYGWCTYNAINHDLIGKTLFIIKLTNNTYKKILIVRKYSTQNKINIRYANINGSELQNIIVDCSAYTKKNFVYFSLVNNTLVDREPESSQWDFLITKYIQIIPAGPGTTMPYPVVGVLANTMKLAVQGVVSYTGVRSAKLINTDPGTSDYSLAAFKTNISTIGYDWKTFDNGTNKYTITNNVVSFIQKPDLSIYKIVFTKYDGSTTGDIGFTTTKLK
jgi:hypothetical protein